MEYKQKLKLHIAYEQKNVGSREKRANIQNKDNQQLRKVKHAISLRVSFWFCGVLQQLSPLAKFYNILVESGERKKKF